MSGKRHTSLMTAADIEQVAGVSRTKATEIIKSLGGVKDVAGRWAVDTKIFMEWYTNPCRSSVAGGGVYNVDIDRITSEIREFASGDSITFTLRKRERSTNWALRVLAEGKKERLISLKTPDKKLAQEIEAQIRSRFREASLSGITPYKTTIFIQDWLAMKEKTVADNSHKRYRSIMDKAEVFLPEFLHQTTNQHIERYKSWMIRESYAARTIIAEINTLSDLMREAVNLGYAKANPVNGVKRPKKPPTEVEPYTQEELDAIFTECERRIVEARDERTLEAWSVYYEVFLCLHYTGMRVSDALSLKWENVSLPFSRIQKRQEKTDKELSARIPTPFKERLALLAQRGAKKSDFIFINTEGSPILYAHMDRAVRIVLKSCGMKKKSPIHSFRHEYIMRMLNDGMPPHVVAAQVGDTVETIVRNYVKAQIASQEQVDSAYSYPQVSRKCPENTAEMAVFGTIQQQDKQPQTVKKAFY